MEGSGLWALGPDERNAAIHEQVRGMALEDVRGESARVFEELIEQLRLLPDEAYARCGAVREHAAGLGAVGADRGQHHLALPRPYGGDQATAGGEWPLSGAAQALGSTTGTTAVTDSRVVWEGVCARFPGRPCGDLKKQLTEGGNIGPFKAAESRILLHSQDHHRWTVRAA